MHGIAARGYLTLWEYVCVSRYWEISYKVNTNYQNACTHIRKCAYNGGRRAYASVATLDRAHAVVLSVNRSISFQFFSSSTLFCSMVLTCCLMQQIKE